MTDLEVAYDRARRLWVVRPFRRDHEPRDGKTFAIEKRKADAVKIAAALGRVFADRINENGACQVIIRRKNNTFGDPSTYGRDPRESVG